MQLPPLPRMLIINRQVSPKSLQRVIILKSLLTMFPIWLEPGGKITYVGHIFRQDSVCLKLVRTVTHLWAEIYVPYLPKTGSATSVYGTMVFNYSRFDIFRASYSLVSPHGEPLEG